MFIDKYAQVPRICGPVVLTLQKLDELYEQNSMNKRLSRTR